MRGGAVHTAGDDQVGFVEVAAAAEDPKVRRLAEAAVGLAVEYVGLAGLQRGWGIDVVPPRVTLFVAAGGEAEDWCGSQLQGGVSRWPRRVWIKASMDPHSIVRLAGHEVKHLSQPPSLYADLGARRARQRREAEAVAFEGEFYTHALLSGHVARWVEEWS